METHTFISILNFALFSCFLYSQFVYFILYRPDDVVTAVTGLTIEVVHTDAEVLNNNL